MRLLNAGTCSARVSSTLSKAFARTKLDKANTRPTPIAVRIMGEQIPCQCQSVSDNSKASPVPTLAKASPVPTPLWHAMCYRHYATPMPCPVSPQSLSASMHYSPFAAPSLSARQALGGTARVTHVHCSALVCRACFAPPSWPGVAFCPIRDGRR